MSQAYATYVNDWLNKAVRYDRVKEIIIWVDGVIPYTPIFWKEGFIHLVRKHDKKHEMFINTNQTAFIRMEKVFK